MRAHAVDLSDTPSHTGPAAAAAFYFCSGATRRPLSAFFTPDRALADPAYRLVAHTRRLFFFLIPLRFVVRLS